MKILNYIKEFFIALAGGTGKKTDIENKPTELENAPIKTGVKIALVRGHGGNDPGASGNNTNEVAYNSWVMDYVEKHAIKNLKCFKGSSSLNAVNLSKSFNPDIVIQMHLNAFNGEAKGCEVLVVKGDVKSYTLAEKFAKEFTTKFNRTLRRSGDKGKKILGASDRGVTSLIASGSVIKILVEPFFIDNKNDFVSKEEYAQFLLEWINGL